MTDWGLPQGGEYLGVSMKKVVLSSCLAVGMVVMATPGLSYGSDYVGSKACADCHEEEYQKFQKHSKKAKSWESIEIMSSDLKDEEERQCYECHTTGYGKGGFVSIEETPHLSDVGCETCHGPGAEHADMGDPEYITRTPEVKDCETCHNSSRVEDFNFKPLIYSGAH